MIAELTDQEREIIRKYPPNLEGEIIHGLIPMEQLSPIFVKNRNW